ncbi:hypothetical protein SLEP1_g51242 [Rubroshorea leprosula]|uniref:Uncharacterized protein n=1 Tax=Rubroshorea leprosula TaxID=152421 RepID=A0AAV5M514_9ROSI|nr:hypothetical protein SLEP1_g51242 [Rubroshorea leprosula]
MCASEVVADIINVEKEVDNESDSDDIETSESNSKTKYQRSTDTLESMRGSGLGLQEEPTKKGLSQIRRINVEMKRAEWANDPIVRDQRRNNVRPSLDQQEASGQQEKGSHQNNSPSETEQGSDSGNRKEQMGDNNKSEKKSKRKRTKTCSSMYKRATLLGLLNQKKGRGKPKWSQVERKRIPEFLPSTSNLVAGGSVGDSGIENCNRLLKEHPNKKIVGDLWNFAKNLGVVAKDEEGVIKKLEMEARDKKAKEAEIPKGACTIQKEIHLVPVQRKFMSRIDRVLLSNGWLAKLGEARQWGLCGSVSDHCPILLRHQQVDWGPKLFRFFDVWLEHEECKELIKDVWCNTNIHGWAGFRLKRKTKEDKGGIKELEQKLILEVDKRINDSTVVIAQTNMKGENG